MSPFGSEDTSEAFELHPATVTSHAGTRTLDRFAATKNHEPGPTKRFTALLAEALVDFLGIRIVSGGLFVFVLQRIFPAICKLSGVPGQSGVARIDVGSNESLCAVSTLARVSVRIVSSGGLGVLPSVPKALSIDGPFPKVRNWPTE